MKELNPSWIKTDLLIHSLAHKIVDSQNKYNFIIGVARGGLIPSVRLSHLLKIKHAAITLESYVGKKRGQIKCDHTISMIGEFKKNDKVLLVDDISDSGSSLEFAVKKVKELAPVISRIDTATIYYKPQSIFKPTFMAEKIDDNVWVNFCWA